MIEISHYTTQFRKDIKICVKRGKNKILIETTRYPEASGVIGNVISKGIGYLYISSLNML